MTTAGTLAQLLLRRKGARIEPPPLPASACVALPEADAAEEVERAPASPPSRDLLSTALIIRYVDAAGAPSERRITLRSVHRHDWEDDWMLVCFCHERNAVRNFRASRVRAAVDLQSGEVIEDGAEILSRFADLGQAQLATPEGAAVEAVRRCRDGLNVLVFLARCDGRMHAEERQVIAQYLMDECFELDFDGDAALARVRRMHPDPAGYEYAIRRLAGDGTRLERVARHAARLIGADGAIGPEETHFAAALQRALLLALILLPLMVAAPAVAGTDGDGPDRLCADRWPNDYQMQAHCRQRQVEGNKQLRAFMTRHDVRRKAEANTMDAAMEMMALCESRWRVQDLDTYDFAMIARCLAKQEEAARALGKLR